MYEYVLFDLDGTLIDPKEGITKCVEYALKQFNIYVKDLNELTVFIGPPLIDSFMKYFNFSYDDAVVATSYYRERFKTYGTNECFLYPHVEDVLMQLKKENKIIALATSKPEEFAKKILDRFNLLSYFDIVVGATFDGTRSKKSDVIKYAITKLNIKNLDSVVMVGDRIYDIMGAKMNQIDSVGVRYGYALPNELENASATYLINDMLDLKKIICLHNNEQVDL